MTEVGTANLIAQVITLVGSIGFFFVAFQALKMLEK